ncbi:hypothetical protein BASA61_001552 [Batrachochytrium salamandrivorans]|nr:hypothetical protein BASA61_001552 [Batrachochytrium salamandrivorans]
MLRSGPTSRGTSHPTSTMTAAGHVPVVSSSSSLKQGSALVVGAAKALERLQHTRSFLNVVSPKVSLRPASGPSLSASYRSKKSTNAKADCGHSPYKTGSCHLSSVAQTSKGVLPRSQHPTLTPPGAWCPQPTLQIGSSESKSQTTLENSGSSSSKVYRESSGTFSATNEEVPNSGNVFITQKFSENVGKVAIEPQDSFTCNPPLNVSGSTYLLDAGSSTQEYSHQVSSEHVSLTKKYTSCFSDPFSTETTCTTPDPVRTLYERESSPETLNLDQKNLYVCPLLVHEHQLRVLNLQGNLISRIENIDVLTRLVSLNLCHNQIEGISGIDGLINLRALMLGCNRIRKIEGLEKLVKLDLLDLHSNQIAIIENMDMIVDLRVLNLEDNLIETVPTLTKLNALEELNLKRNKICAFSNNDHLENLHRLFLSENNIDAVDDISAVFDLPSLTELTIETNKATDQTKYRLRIISRCKNIKLLDGRRVLDEERRSASKIAKKETDRKRAIDRRSTQVEERLNCITNIKKLWEQEMELLSSTSLGNEEIQDISYDVDNAYVEVDHTTLRIYGKGMSALNKVDTSTITAVEFHMVQVSSLSSAFVKLAGFHFLNKLKIGPAALARLKQLSPLARLRSLACLDISPQNPITNLPVFRSFAIALLADSLEQLCGIPVTSVERKASKAHYGALCNLVSQDETDLLEKSTPIVRLDTQKYVRSLIDQGIETHQKNKLINSIWQKLTLTSCMDAMKKQTHPASMTDELTRAVAAQYLSP